MQLLKQRAIKELMCILQTLEKSMSVTVERRSNEPIIIVTFSSISKLQDQLREVHSKVSQLMVEDNTEFYRIDNYGSLPLSISHLVEAMSEESQSRPGSATDPKV